MPGHSLIFFALQLLLNIHLVKRNRSFRTYVNGMFFIHISQKSRRQYKERDGRLTLMACNYLQQDEVIKDCIHVIRIYVTIYAAD